MRAKSSGCVSSRLTVGQPEVHCAREIPLTAVRIVRGFASENQRDKQMNGRSLLGFCLYVPRDRERGATLAGTDQAAFLQGFHRIAISRCGAHDFIILQAAQDWVTTERIRLKLVSMLHVPNQILLCLREFRRTAPACFFAIMLPPNSKEKSTPPRPAVQLLLRDLVA